MQMLHSGIDNLSVVAAQHLLMLRVKSRGGQQGLPLTVMLKEYIMTNMTQNASYGGLLQRLAETFEDLQARWTRYTVYRTTLSELEELTDRDLADLGLNRSLIKSVAYEAAYKV